MVLTIFDPAQCHLTLAYITFKTADDDRGLKNASLAEIANCLSPDVQDQLICTLQIVSDQDGNGKVMSSQLDCIVATTLSINCL